MFNRKIYLREYSKLHRKKYQKKLALAKKRYYNKHKKRLLAKGKRYRKKHSTKIKKQILHYYKKHRNEILIYKKKYIKKHKIRLTMLQKLYRKKYRTKLLAQKKVYRTKHRKRILVQQKLWYNKNKFRVSKLVKQYYKKNKTAIHEWQRIYNGQHYNNDPLFKLSMLLRVRLNMAIKRNQKKGSAVRDLGCSIPEFKKYIESKFYSNMTWDNHGMVWELDHIIPLCKFDLTKRSQLLKAVHYTNLQPLMIPDHKKKTVKDLLNRRFK
ncbi:MAG: hypothetical protein ACREBR_05480 [bacterium]